MPGIEDLPTFLLIAALLLWLVFSKRAQVKEPQPTERQKRKEGARRRLVRKIRIRQLRDGGQLPDPDADE